MTNDKLLDIILERISSIVKDDYKHLSELALMCRNDREYLDAVIMLTSLMRKIHPKFKELERMVDAIPL